MLYLIMFPKITAVCHNALFSFVVKDIIILMIVLLISHKKVAVKLIVNHSIVIRKLDI